MYATSRKNDNGLYLAKTNRFMKISFNYISKSIVLQSMKVCNMCNMFTFSYIMKLFERLVEIIVLYILTLLEIY